MIKMDLNNVKKNSETITIAMIVTNQGLTLIFPSQ